MTYAKMKLGLLAHFGAGAGIVGGIYAYSYPEVPNFLYQLQVALAYLVYIGYRGITEKNILFRRWFVDTLAYYSGVYMADHLIHRGLGVPRGHKGGTTYWPGHFGPG